MDSNNKRKYIPGILIMTVIFLVLSIFSVNNMMKGSSEKKKEIKGSYQTLLENRLNTQLEGEDEFMIFESIGYDLLVVPDKYNNYFKPCFDFVVVRDGIIVKNFTSKEFLKYPLLSIGSKIVKIGDKELNGLGYFEIIDLIYTSELNVSKMFTLENGQVFEYRYENETNKMEVNKTEKEVTIKMFNLNNFNRKGVYEKAKGVERVTIDLTNASVTDMNSIKAFMSFFTRGDEELFSIPQKVKSLESYKLDNVTIVLNENNDKGVLFMASALKSLNSNVRIVGQNHTVNEYKTYTILKNADYKIYLYDYVLKTRISTGGSGVII